MGPCVNGPRVGKKVNLLQEIPFATQQAWHGKRRKERKYRVSVMHATGSAALQEQNRPQDEHRLPPRHKRAHVYPPQHAQRAS